MEIEVTHKRCECLTVSEMSVGHVVCSARKLLKPLLRNRKKVEVTGKSRDFERVKDRSMTAVHRRSGRLPSNQTHPTSPQ